MNRFVVNPDPELDLVLRRKTALSPDLIWRAYTTPRLLEQWFCPRPYRAIEWELELFPGGAFASVIVSPEGERFPSSGCVLVAEENRRLVFTSTMSAGFRPNPSPSEDSFLFTAVIDIEPDGEGSIYTATAMHANREAKQKHEAMGFEAGWGAAFDQLIELMSSSRSG